MEWKQRCFWMLIGGLAAGAAISATYTYSHFRVENVIYGRSDARHAVPNLEAIAAIGSRAVPSFCAAIAIEWHPSADVASARIIAWTRALGAIGDARALPTLIALASDPHPVMRKWATLSLWRLGDARALEALKSLAADDPDPEIRQIARDAHDALAHGKVK